MSTKMRLKTSNETSLKTGKSMRSKAKTQMFWERGKLPYTGITVIIENVQSHAVKPQVVGPESVQLLGTVDPVTQTKGRIFYLTAKYWTQLNPWSFQRSNGILDDDGVLHEVARQDLSSYRYEPLNAGIDDTGHPDNIVTEFQKDDEGNLTTRRKMDGEKRWTNCYPAVEKKTIPMDITNRCQIIIPEYVVRQFRAMVKAGRKAPAGRGKPKIFLLEESVRLLARNHIPVCHQTVNALVATANDGKGATRMSVHNALRACGLVRLDTLSGYGTAVYGLPDLSESSMTEFARLSRNIRGRRMTDHNDRQINAGQDFDYLDWMQKHPANKAWDGTRVEPVKGDRVCWPNGFKPRTRKAKTSA